jgi:hypothetical protein
MLELSGGRQWPSRELLLDNNIHNKLKVPQKIYDKNWKLQSARTKRQLYSKQDGGKSAALLPQQQMCCLSAALSATHAVYCMKSEARSCMMSQC